MVEKKSNSMVNDAAYKLAKHLVDETFIGGNQTGEMKIGGEVTTSRDQFIELLAEKLRESTPDSSPGSGGGVESVTYAELVALISGSGLTVGGQYLITDFATKHYIVDSALTKPAGNPTVTGVMEPLLVTAVSVNKLDKVAKSTLYPQDIIHVDFISANWTSDISFSDSGVIVSGWKGTIYFRHDTLLDNYMGYDFRNCKFRRWKTDVAAWDTDVTYAKGDFVKQTTFIYRSLTDANIGNTPTSSSVNWLRLMNLGLTEYYNNNPTSTNGIPSGTDFIDAKTFQEGESENATYEICCRSNHFAPFSDIELSILSNNVFFLQDEDGYFTILANQFGAQCYFNTVAYTLSYNTIGNNFYNNIIGDTDFSQNLIGNYFRNNITGVVNYNIIGNSFSGNYVGTDFAYNTVGNDIGSNTIGKNVNTNTIGTSFSSNYVGHNFKNNLVYDGSCSSIDFFGATYVYASYNTTIFKREDLTVKLSYFDNSDALTVVAANA